jgi:hypothetical protein
MGAFLRIDRRYGMRNLLIWACLLGVLGYFGSKFYLHDKVSRNLDTVLDAARPFVDVEYEDVSSTLSGTLSVDGITARITGFSDPLKIESVSIVTPGYFHLLELAGMGGDNPRDFEIPEALAIAFDGISVGVDADFMNVIEEARAAQYGIQDAANPAAQCVGKNGFSADTLKRLGYSTMVVDAAFGYRRENAALVLDMSTNIEDMYDMAVALTFDSVPSPQSVMTGSYQPRLVKGRMEYVDRSLEKRVMKLCTEAEGLPVETVIAARVDAFQAVAGTNDIEFDEYVIDPYMEFLNGGKQRFVITAQPTEPVNLTQLGLYKPSDVPALLNLSAEAL